MLFQFSIDWVILTTTLVILFAKVNLFEVKTMPPSTTPSTTTEADKSGFNFTDELKHRIEQLSQLIPDRNEMAYQFWRAGEAENLDTERFKRIFHRLQELEKQIKTNIHYAVQQEKWTLRFWIKLRRQKTNEKLDLVRNRVVALRNVYCERRVNEHKNVTEVMELRDEISILEGKTRRLEEKLNIV